MSDTANMTIYDKLYKIDIEKFLAHKDSGSYTMMTAEEKKNKDITKYAYNKETKKYEISPGGNYKKVTFSYLSWATAWHLFKTNCPDAEFKIREFDNKPYLFDENLGYMVFTQITTNGETKCMHLPVMDNKNHAKKHKPYDIPGKYVHTVEPATMRDINDTIMRCLVKNIALFGLGITIYNGEDFPEGGDVPASTISDVETDIKPKDANDVELPINDTTELKSDVFEQAKRELCNKAEIENAANLLLMHDDIYKNKFGADHEKLVKAIKGKCLKLKTYELMLNIFKETVNNAS